MLIVVWLLRPVATALPLLAVAAVLTVFEAVVLAVAVVFPAPPPPAASTEPVFAVELLLPFWPVALAEPVDA